MGIECPTPIRARIVRLAAIVPVQSGRDARMHGQSEAVHGPVLLDVAQLALLPRIQPFGRRDMLDADLSVLAAQHGVVGAALVENICARTADQRVDSGAADQHVVAAATDQNISSRATDQGRRTAARIEVIVAVASHDQRRQADVSGDLGMIVACAQPYFDALDPVPLDRVEVPVPRKEVRVHLEPIVVAVDRHVVVMVGTDDVKDAVPYRHAGDHGAHALRIAAAVVIDQAQRDVVDAALVVAVAGRDRARAVRFGDHRLRNRPVSPIDGGQVRVHRSDVGKQAG